MDLYVYMSCEHYDTQKEVGYYICIYVYLLLTLLYN